MKILNYREQDPSAKFIAYFDLFLEDFGLTLRNLKLIKSAKGHYFVAFPSFCEDFNAAQKKFVPYMEFSKEKAQEFQVKCKELLADMLGTDL